MKDPINICPGQTLSMAELKEALKICTYLKTNHPIVYELISRWLHVEDLKVELKHES